MQACVMDDDIVYIDKRIGHHLYMETGIAFLGRAVDAFMDNPRLFVGDYLGGKYLHAFSDHSRYVPLALAVLFYRERSSFTMRHDLAYNQIYAKAYESAVPVIKNRLIAHQLDVEYARSVFAAVVQKLADAHDFESVPLPNIARILAGYKTRRDLCGLIQERDLIATSWRDNDKAPVRFYEINEKDDPDFFLCDEEVDKMDESEIFHADDLRLDRYMHALGFLPKGLGAGSRMPLEILLRAGESIGLCVVDWEDMLSENNPLDVAETIPSGDEELGMFMPSVNKKPSRSLDDPLLHDFIDLDESFVGLVSPIRRFGGKIRMTRNILDYLPRAHRGNTYVEPFAGSAAVLFARPSVGVEVINDMDGEVVNFFMMLRDHADDLQRYLQSTPYARSLHEEYAGMGMNPCTLSPVERAARFFYLSRTSFMADLENPSFGFAKKLDNRADAMRHAVDDLLTFRDRLRRVIIDHDDYAAILTRYDDPDTVFYCDPPYLDSTRKSGGYVNDMESAEDHAILLDRLVDLQGYVALSGYPSELYAKRLETTGWTFADFPVTCRSGRTRGVESTDTARVERLWLNPKLSLYRAANMVQAKTLSLFEQEFAACAHC